MKAPDLVLQVDFVVGVVQVIVSVCTTWVGVVLCVGVSNGCMKCVGSWILFLLNFTGSLCSAQNRWFETRVYCSRKDGKGFNWYWRAIKNTKEYKMRASNFKEKILKKSPQLACKNDKFVKKT